MRTTAKNFRYRCNSQIQSTSKSSPLMDSYAKRLCLEELEDRQMLAVFSVSNLNDSGSGSLRNAIHLANDSIGSDNIEFSVVGTINIASQLPTITDAVSIIGQGQEFLVINAGNGVDGTFSTGDGYRIFDIDDGNSENQIEVMLSGISLIGGDSSSNGGAVRSVENLAATNLGVRDNASTEYGGGFFTAGTFTLTASNVEANSAGNRGGGIAGIDTSMSVLDSNISGNTGLGGGGLFNEYKTTHIENSTISDNTASSIGGGGIRNYQGSLNIINSKIERNSASYGGGIRSNFGDVTITGSVVGNNTGTTSFNNQRGGGGIDVRRGDLLITESHISGNTSKVKGGGIYLSNAPTQIVESTIQNNYTESSGGGIYFRGSDLLVERSVVANNAAKFSGGGIRRTAFDAGSLSVVDSQIIKNTAGFDGGGISAALIEISGSTIADNSSTMAGGGIEGFTIVITGSLVSNNQSGDVGGGIEGSSITAVNSTVSGNSAGSDGGAIFSGYSVVIEDSHVEGNSSNGRGGGIDTDLLQMSRTTITGNLASTFGGGLSIRGGDGTRTISESVIGKNTSGLDGGGIHTSGITSIIDTDIIDNISEQEGGGIYGGSGSLSISESRIVGNTSGHNGGGIRFIGGFRNGILSITQSLISGNNSNNYGGGIFSTDDTTISDSHITWNSAAANGGGIYVLSRDLAINGSYFGRNTTEGQGGGIFARADITINFSNITGNSSVQHGGGVYQASGDMNMFGSSISNNLSGGRGGGLHHHVYYYNDNLIGGNLTISSSTISGNEADDNGAGIYIWSETEVIDASIHHSTIAENSSSRIGGGLVLSTGTMNIDHTIIAKNQAALGSDLAGFVGVQFDANFSLIGDSSLSGLTEAPVGSPDSKGNLIGGPSNGLIDPLLAAAGHNGGAGLSHELLPGSPALEAGSPSAVAGVGTVPVFDGRGFFSRIAGQRIDIGAYELQSTANMPLVVDTLQDVSNGNYDAGNLSLREAVGLANGNPSILDEITFTTELADLEQAVILLIQGEIAVTDSLTITGLGQELLLIDVSTSDPTPSGNNGDGSRIFNVDNGNFSADIDVILSGFTLSGGDVEKEGGAIRNRENLTINNSRISGNASVIGGGGVFSRGAGSKLNVLSSTIEHNTSAFHGGGIYAVTHSDGALHISDSTISWNQAISDIPTRSTLGGGVYFHFLASGDVFFSIDSSTISNNYAGARGGGVYDGSGTIEVISTTITKNFSGNEGGGLASQSRIVLDHTIVADNTSGTTTSHDIVGGGDIHHSLIGDGTGWRSVIPDDNLVGTPESPIDPLLGPLADNGGSTQTHALLPGSPALDAGDSEFVAPVDYDQRGVGFSRIELVRIDIGAYESQIFPSADFDADGDVDGGDFLAWQRGFGKANAIQAEGNSDDDMDVDASDLTAWQISYGQEFVSPQTASIKSSKQTEERSTLDEQVSSVEIIDTAITYNLTHQTSEEEPLIFDELGALNVVDGHLSAELNEYKRATTTASIAKEPNAKYQPTFELTDVEWLSDELLEQIFG